MIFNKGLKRLTMNVSKISILNVNNAGTSLFFGEVPASREKKSHAEKIDASLFLKGAGIVSAGILATALAARAGLFGRPKKQVVTLLNLPEQIRNRLAPYDKPPVNRIFHPVNPPVEERLRVRAENIKKYRAKIKSKIDYSKFEKYTTKEEQDTFFNNINSSLDGMSYTLQYKEFKYFLDFLKTLEPEQLKTNIKFNIDNFKRDNKLRVARDIIKFSKRNPEYQPVLNDFVDEAKVYFVDYSKYREQATKGMQAAFFTDVENKIANLRGEVQIDEFENYLDFIKTLNPDDIKDSILFTLGKYDWDNNVKIAQMALKFAEENMGYKYTILNNLVAYEGKDDFTRELAYSNFWRTDSIADIYDNHVDNIIKIRKLLTESGLKCDKRTRLKNRQDWIDIGFPTPNRYMLCFHNSPRLSEIRKSAFEYDMMNGITQEDAEYLIKKLSTDTSIAKKSMEEVLKEVDTNKMTAERAESLLKQLVEDKKLLDKMAAEIKLPEQNVAADLLFAKVSIDNAQVQRDIRSIFEEFENSGIPQSQVQKMLTELTTERTQTETQIKYGMTLEEMIEKINNAVISTPA